MLMRRVVFWLIVSVTIVIIAERRLSDGTTHRSQDPIPELWEAVPHAAWTPATPALNCAMVMAPDRANPYRFTSIERGVPFDIEGNGDLDHVSWTETDSDVAFLGVDLNGDGRITSGKELIGEHTLLGARN